MRARSTAGPPRFPWPSAPLCCSCSRFSAADRSWIRWRWEVVPGRGGRSFSESSGSRFWRAGFSHRSAALARRSSSSSCRLPGQRRGSGGSWARRRPCARLWPAAPWLARRCRPGRWPCSRSTKRAGPLCRSVTTTSWRWCSWRFCRPPCSAPGGPPDRIGGGCVRARRSSSARSWSGLWPPPVQCPRWRRWLSRR